MSAIFKQILKGNQHYHTLLETLHVYYRDLGVQVPPMWAWMPTPYMDTTKDVPGLFITRGSRGMSEGIDGALYPVPEDVLKDRFDPDTHAYLGRAIEPGRISRGGTLGSPWCEHPYQKVSPTQVEIEEKSDRPIVLGLINLEQGIHENLNFILGNSGLGACTSEVRLVGDNVAATVYIHWDELGFMTGFFTGDSMKESRSRMCPDRKYTFQFLIEPPDSGVYAIEVVPDITGQSTGIYDLHGVDVQKGGHINSYIDHEGMDTIDVGRSMDYVGVKMDADPFQGMNDRGTVLVKSLLEFDHGVKLFDHAVFSTIEPLAFSMSCDFKKQRWTAHNADGVLIDHLPFDQCDFDPDGLNQYGIYWDREEDFFGFSVNGVGVQGTYGDRVKSDLQDWVLSKSNECTMIVNEIVYFAKNIFDQRPS